jgi:hypothetical protein
LPLLAQKPQTARVIANVIIHLNNDLPILVDLERLPDGPDRSIICTNVRTIDGKRPAFVHDPKSTFVFPLSVIRLIEARRESLDPTGALQESQEPPAQEPETYDEEPDEDLLAKIRSI